MAARFQNVQPYTLNGISEIEVSDDEEDIDSEDACGDVQDRSAAASKFYGVLWTSFSQGHSRRIRYESFLKLLALIQEPNVAKWYVGVLILSSTPLFPRRGAPQTELRCVVIIIPRLPPGKIRKKLARHFAEGR